MNVPDFKEQTWAVKIQLVAKICRVHTCAIVKMATMAFIAHKDKILVTRVAIWLFVAMAPVT